MSGLWLGFFIPVFIFGCVHGFYLVSTTERLKTEDHPQEVQHAVCHVLTKEIEASAKATITRHLKGVCSSTQLNTGLENLQTKILQEISEIKTALGTNHYKTPLQPKNVYSKILDTTTTTELPLYPFDYPEFSELQEDSKFLNEKLKNLPTGALRLTYDDSNLREEISMYNDTVVESSEGDLYLYYWKIPEIGKILTKKGIYVSSFSFLVLGHTLHLDFYPNYLDEYVGIQLKPDSNGFLKKHKIIYIGQSSSTQNQISSKVLYGINNEEKMFKIESQMLDRNFIAKDSLLVKLKIYLNS